MVREAILSRFFIGIVALAAAFLTICQVDPARAQDRALIVAIDEYADTRLADFPNKLAENDAAAIEKLLTGKLGFKPEDIKVLRNERATKSAILQGIREWLNPDKPGKPAKKSARLKGVDESGALDNKNKPRRVAKRRKWTPPPPTYRSYFYFAGLGYIQRDQDGDEKDGYDETLVPFDASIATAGGEDPITGMITDDELEAILGTFRNRHVTIVVDAGHSGLVTRSVNLAARLATRMRVPNIDDAVRSISTDDWLADHKAEGAFVNVRIPGGSVSVWSASAPTQTPIIAGEDAEPQGLFTLLYVEGLETGRADANSNGIISNVELLRHIIDGSRKYCSAFQERCELGLRPRLHPITAYGKSAWVDRKTVSHRKESDLSLERLKDFLASDGDHKIEITQSPASPIHVGETGIRYEVTTTEPGYVILLNLTATGELFQLYPNQYSGAGEDAKLHLVRANTPLLVPEKSYGVTMSATEAGKGHVIALLVPDSVVFDAPVTDRAISFVSSDEAIHFYLAHLAAALYRPLNLDVPSADTGTTRWYMKDLAYEILP